MQRYYFSIDIRCFFNFTHFVAGISNHHQQIETCKQINHQLNFDINENKFVNYGEALVIFKYLDNKKEMIPLEMLSEIDA